ncbi:MAG: NAD(P)-binding protein, partial [Elusimicrobia bacterium]|nr:NAD(P)-binding protein [Elusimicrobiota bacterium]
MTAAAGSSRQNPYVVVGAGAQGLTFALGLARRGLPVILCERSGVLGGQARSFRYGRFTFDFGLHAFVTKSRPVEDFVRGILGDDFASFYPRAASHWGGDKLVEDSSSWRVQNLHRRLYALLPKASGREWSCMRISKPPKTIYPKRGGFGAIFELMGRELKRSGGQILLETPMEARD